MDGWIDRWIDDLKQYHQEDVKLIRDWVDKSPHMHSIKKGKTSYPRGAWKGNFPTYWETMTDRLTNQRNGPTNRATN